MSGKTEEKDWCCSYFCLIQTKDKSYGANRIFKNVTTILKRKHLGSQNNENLIQGKFLQNPTTFLGTFLQTKSI